MTNKLKLLTASLLIFSVACTDQGELDAIQYKMVNNSEHKITLTVESRNFPAEVILQDGKSYEWICPTEHGSYFMPFMFTGKGEIRVEYDDSYVTVFSHREGNQRTPLWESNYVKQKTGKHKYLYTYTFTKEDYENAVNP
ncbi:hypothetical protein [Alistipes timonensis]